MKEVIIIGAGGLGRELASSMSLDGEIEVIGFCDDGMTPGEWVNDLQVLGNTEWLANQPTKITAIFGIGSPMMKHNLARRLVGKINWINSVSEYARLHNTSTISLGEGNFIADGSILTTNISLGNHNLVNLNCSIGHDVTMGSYNSVMPGVSISGGAQISNQVYIGTGAKLIKATRIGEGAVIGAGAVVNTDIPAGEVWAGIPAKRIK